MSYGGGEGGGDGGAAEGGEGEEGGTTTEEEVVDEYVFVEWDLFEFYFGFMMGSLNTLPVGSSLYTCGKNLRAQRGYVDEMLILLESRDILKTIDKASRVLLFINSTAVYCFRGVKELYLDDAIPNLILKLDLV